MAQQTHVRNVMDVIDKGLRQYQDGLRKAAEDISMSPDAPIDSLKDLNKTTEQQSLGKDQQAEAEAAGSTVTTADPNASGNGQEEVDKRTPKTMDMDQTAMANSESLPNIEVDMKGTEQKIASYTKTASAMLQRLAQVSMAPAPKVAAAPARPMAKTAADVLLAKVAAAADEAAAVYRDNFIYGQLNYYDKLGQITQMMKSAGMDDEEIQAVGGPEAVAEQVAADDPAAMLPEGVNLPPEMAGGEGDTGGEVEGGEEMPIDPAELDALVTELDDAGVTPEALAQLLDQVQELEGSGASDAEIGAVTSEAIGAPDEEQAKTAAGLDPQRLDAVRAVLYPAFAPFQAFLNR